MDKKTDELISAFVAQGGRAQDWRPLFSVAPTNAAPIVRERRRPDASTTDSNTPADTRDTHDADPAASDLDSNRQLELASWGFAPSWAKTKGLAPINARLETAATNTMFRNAFAKQRCLVPMAGYYEWKAEKDGKQPYFLHANDNTLSAAGLYTAKEQEDGWQLSFTIITCSARDEAGEVHDRMPVFVTPEFHDQWLDPTAVDPVEATRLLEYNAKEVARTITSYPVSRRLNNVRNVDPTDSTLLDLVTPDSSSSNDDGQQPML